MRLLVTPVLWEASDHACPRAASVAPSTSFPTELSDAAASRIALLVTWRALWSPSRASSVTVGRSRMKASTLGSQSASRTMEWRASKSCSATVTSSTSTPTAAPALTLLNQLISSGMNRPARFVASAVVSPNRMIFSLGRRPRTTAVFWESSKVSCCHSFAEALPSSASEVAPAMGLDGRSRVEERAVCHRLGLLPRHIPISSNTWQLRTHSWTETRPMSAP
mmetsp:Transcript_57770/g.78752  ORF Transcript_57770/g.78752 Transcript_57770/m.78752 type:complete len:222 (-) Transcript_57770:1087-1752(-)